MKFARHMWVKVFATLLCIVSILGAGSSLVVLSMDAMVASKETLHDEIYDAINDCYSANLLKQLNDYTDVEELQGALDNLKDIMDSRYHFAIVKSQKGDAKEAIADIASGAKDAIVYGTAKDVANYQHVFQGSNEASYVASENMNSIVEMLRKGSYAYRLDGEEYGEEVLQVTYLLANGIFYYETESGNYPVHTVLIYSDANNYKTYSLVENENKSLSYISEDGEKLTGEYQSWYAVSLENEQGTQRTIVPYYDEKFAPGICIFVSEQEADAYELYGYEDTYVADGLLWHNKKQVTYYYVLSYVDKVSVTTNSSNADGIFDQVDDLWKFYCSLTDAAIWIEIICVIIFIGSLIVLCSGAGRRVEDEEIHLRLFDHVWGEVLIICDVLLGVLLGMAIIAIAKYWNGSLVSFFMLEMQLVIGMIFICLSFGVTVVVRIKAKKFIRYTFLYWILHGIKAFFVRMHTKLEKFKMVINQNKSLKRKTIEVLLVGTFLVFVSFVFGCMMFGEMHQPQWAFLWFLCITFIVWTMVLLVVQELDILFKANKRIANGDLNTPVDENKLWGPFKEGAIQMNHIQDGIQAAVAQQMKSEHFKTELITNVSHDIKTPLTSIINYVDLMEKQGTTDPTMQEYMDVLDRQSKRLKKLIEDLMEASKASTGNLQVNLEKCDAHVLLTQVVGEFEEKLQNAGLNLVIDSQEEPVWIFVDGRHIWRVFENLLNNICKYAQPDTRVYISLAERDNEVEIIFRNISKYQLNISGEELMERFVRGDSSRNTEGSGLGLSIAQSLTNLMKGHMEIQVDGDLFKVILFFPIVS